MNNNEKMAARERDLPIVFDASAESAEGRGWPLLSEAFRTEIAALMARGHFETAVTKENVYQEADEETLAIVDRVVGELALPGSGVAGMANLVSLAEKARAGHACLLLLEHYSNLDLPAFSHLLRYGDNDGAAGGGDNNAEGADIAHRLTAIAGIKLNESNPAVAAFTAAFTRIVICPSRSLTALSSEADKAEHARTTAINMAAMKTLTEVKRQGKLVLVFPSGTRYRPWDEGTKRGVREMDSYIKSFDYMCFVAVNGNSLIVREADMIDDFVVRSVLRFTAGPVLDCAAFRAAVHETIGDDPSIDKKQAVADRLMENLAALHDDAEKERQKIIERRAAAAQTKT